MPGSKQEREIRPREDPEALEEALKEEVVLEED